MALKAAEEARKDAEGFRLQIAKANERASAAEKATEDERLARVRIEEKLGGWKLDAAAQARIIGKLETLKGTPYDLGANPNEVSFHQHLDDWREIALSLFIVTGIVKSYKACLPIYGNPTANRLSRRTEMQTGIIE